MASVTDLPNGWDAMADFILDLSNMTKLTTKSAVLPLKISLTQANLYLLMETLAMVMSALPLKASLIKMTNSLAMLRSMSALILPISRISSTATMDSGRTGLQRDMELKYLH